MRSFLERLERLFAAIGFAEAGEHETARGIVTEQKAAGGTSRRIGKQQNASATAPVWPARRAA